MKQPIHCRWDGTCLTPVPASQNAAETAFELGQRYPIQIAQQRSPVSHRHYFACIKEAWENIPDEDFDDFPSPDHLRKYALVRSGYATKKEVVCIDAQEARKFTVQCKRDDEYAVVDLKNNVVTLWTAESQNYRDMSRERFQKSKDAVFDWIAKRFGIDTDELGKAA